MANGFAHMGTRLHEAYRAELLSQTGRSSRRRPTAEKPSLRDRVGLGLIALGERMVLRSNFIGGDQTSPVEVETVGS